MNVTTDDLDWDKPLIWLENLKNLYLPAILVSKNCVKSDKEKEQSGVKERFCVFVTYKGSSGLEGVIRHVDESGKVGNARYLFNESEMEVAPPPVEEVKPLKDDSVENLGVL